MKKTSSLLADSVRAQFEESAELKQKLAATLTGKIVETAESIVAALRSGGKLLVLGNGGSAADAQHFAGEMIGRFKRERLAIPAVALTTDTSILTAVGNDYGFEYVFLRQVEGLGKKGDVAFGISTSGKAANVRRALVRAKELGMATVGLLGGDGGSIAEICDYVLLVPAFAPPRIQEAHITIIHILCDIIESTLFSG